MAIRTLPVVAGIPALIFKVDLDGRPFKFEFTFNDRAGLWNMTIFNDADEVLLAGKALHVKQLLLELHQYNQALPQGNLFMLNLANENVNPTLENFGSDVLLLYEDVG